MPGIRLSTLVRRLRRDTAPGEGCSDADLLARFGRARDDAAFELLVWRHGAMVLGTCQRTLGHTEDAEDAFQATFLVLARKAAGIGYGVALPAWLHRVAVRIAARLGQRRRPAMPLNVETAGLPASDPVERAEGLTVLDEEINRLPERCRRAVVLCYLEGLTASDAARLLGCPTGTVESRLATARKTLRDRLTRRGVTLPAGVLAVLAGQAMLAPEAVARVVRASVAFLRDSAAIATGIVGESSVKLAQGVLTMWTMRMRARLLAVATVVATSAGVVWADWEDPAVVADEPAAKPVVAIAPPPVAKAEPPADPPVAKVEAWPLAKEISLPGILKGITPDGRSFIYQHGETTFLLHITSSDPGFSFGSANMLQDVALSPDGKFIATAEGTNGVKLREAATGKILEALWPSGGLTPHQVVFAPDSTKLIALCSRSESTDGGGQLGGAGDRPPVRKGPTATRKTTLLYQISVWDLATRKEVGWSVNSISSSPNSSPRRIEFAVGGRFVVKIEQLANEVDGKRVADGYRVGVIDPLTGGGGRSCEFRIPGFTPAATAELTVSPDGGAMIAVNATTRELLIFDTTTGQERLRLGRLPREIRAVAFSPDGKRIAATTWTGGPSGSFAPNDGGLTGPTEVVIWDATTGKELARLGDKATNRNYQSIRFSQDGLYLIAQDGENNQYRRTTIWGRLPEPKPVTPTPVAKGLPKPEAPAGVPDRFQALIRDLSADAVTDSRRVEGVFMSVLGRLPTDVEAQLLTTQFARQTDKAAAMRDLLASLVNTPEFKAHIAALQKLAK